MTLVLTVGDSAPPFAGTINAGTVGASAVVHIRRSDASVVSRTADTLTDSGDGSSAWTLDTLSTDLTVTGPYTIEVQVTFSDGTVETFSQGANGKPSTFVVKQQIA